jgi:hypothetical protein
LELERGQDNDKKFPGKDVYQSKTIHVLSISSLLSVHIDQDNQRRTHSIQITERPLKDHEFIDRVIMA